MAKIFIEKLVPCQPLFTPAVILYLYWNRLKRHVGGGGGGKEVKVFNPVLPACFFDRL